MMARWDKLVTVALFLGGLVVYVSTLAPGTLDGDAALFQYTPWVLGVTYPTGYPTYILLGRLWTALVPIGSVAYRMNLSSAVCGALALALLYPTARRLLEQRLAALLAVLIFATLPTYWRWATEAKIYTLHILFLSGMLFVLSRCGEEREQGLGNRALLASILFGLALGNHSTTLLLVPGLALFWWLNCRPARNNTPYETRNSHPGTRTPFYVLRFIPYVLPAVVLPLLLYLYVPLRAEVLLAREGTLPGLVVPVAVARGLVADFYHSGLEGLVRYFSAADFTDGVVTNWGLVPGQLLSVYWPLMRDDFDVGGALLGLVGAVYLAAWRPRRFWPLFLMYATLIPFVLAYGQGEQSAFLLPSSLVLAIFGGAAVAGGLRLMERIRGQGSGGRDRLLNLKYAVQREGAISKLLVRFTAAAASLALVVVVAWLPARQAQRNVEWLTHKWDDAAYQYWTDVLAHPMEEGAGMLAHWGDLTSFWYLQHVEGLRPDLYGLYPPTETVIADWLAAGHDLYIAGPLQDQTSGVEAHYQLLPWGRLVRLAPLEADPEALLPDLADVAGEVQFGGRIRLLKAGFDAQAPSGGILAVSLAWKTADDLRGDTHVSLRLVAEDGTRAGQTDQALVSGWLPADTLTPGQVLLSFHRFKLPAGTLPGEYRLQLAVEDWPMADGQVALDLGAVTVTPADPSQPLDPWGEYKPLKEVNFGGQIRLVGYDYSVTRARQGRGFSARFLWQALRPPDADYTLLVELVDGEGKVWRDWRHVPAEGRAPVGAWSVGKLVQDQIALVLPANAPPGEDSLRVRLAWERADGTRLPARRWLLPAGQSITLPGVRVIEEERVFDLPPIQTTTDADFDDKMHLVGYDLPVLRMAPGDTLPLTLVWQSLTSDMRESYSVFVHLVGPDGAIHGQWDKEPGARGKRPTTSWVTGEVVVDPIPVPLAPDAPPGTYRVLVGVYLAPDGPRLPLRDAAGGTGGDALELTQIEVGE